MTIDELIVLLTNQVATLNNARATAQALGDLDHILIIDAKILETETTLDQLRNLPG